MKQICQSTFIEKKSKFIAHLYLVSNEEEIQEIVNDLKTEHRKAAHVCWAAMIDTTEMISNDGEVGNPANTMLEVLRSNKKRKHLIAVVRYFGGVKLGPGGVKRSFKKAMLECL